MPSYTSRDHRAILEVRKPHPSDHYGDSLPFLASYILADAYEAKIVYPGLLLSVIHMGTPDAAGSYPASYYVPTMCNCFTGEDYEDEEEYDYELYPNDWQQWVCRPTHVLTTVVDATMESQPHIEPLEDGTLLLSRLYALGCDVGAIHKNAVLYLQYSGPGELTVYPPTGYTVDDWYSLVSS